MTGDNALPGDCKGIYYVLIDLPLIQIQIY